MKKVISDTRVPIKIWTNDIEIEAEQQLRDLASMPFVEKHIAVMPDVHSGKGSTIGTVLATKGAIICACVGVDIGCGMSALKLPFKIDILKDLSKLRYSIERSVPTGRNSNHKLTETSVNSFKALGEISEAAKEEIKNVDTFINKTSLAIGSLGGGNHFIEICGDENNDAWIMLHSGSRNPGKVLAEVHINKAKGLMKEFFISPPNIDLAYLPQNTKEFKDYIHDLNWAQNLALANRNEIMDRTLREVLYHVEKLNEYKGNDFFRINCHHNYVNLEHHFGKNMYITRKGAVSARAGEWGIIPGSMSTGSFIVKGLGNIESFCSCSHGAGRKMSRTKARQLFTQDDLINSLKGIEARTDNNLIDEIQYAYKDLNEVMDNQKDLVEPIHRLTPILNIKGD